MRINDSSVGLPAQRNLFKVDQTLGQALEKLSSGLRINRASDDAAGLGLAERLLGQVRGLSMAERNVQDGLGFLQTADGALSAISDILQRMREMAVEGANGTMTNTQREPLDLEAAELSAEIDRIGTSTIFNGQNVFTLDPIIQVGANQPAGANRITINLQAVTSAALPGLNAAGGTQTTDVSATGVDLSTRTAAQTEIGQFNTAITRYGNYRAQVGALINRLESALLSIQTTRDSLAQAEGRIRNVDKAREVNNLTRGQILVESGTAMLAQANVRRQSVIELIQPIAPYEPPEKPP